MNESCQIFSEDIFLSTGISLLLDKMFKTSPEFKRKKYHFILLSSVSLFNLAQLYHRLDPQKAYIVIGNTAACAMLNGTGLVIAKFINISMSVSDIEYELHMLLKSFITNEVSPTPTKLAILTLRERIVLKYITMGINPFVMARMLGMSIKAISTHKRSIMKKLGVSSNQQLLVKSHLYMTFYNKKTDKQINR
ncbi:LuxR C-terminal-related transcriptional regulator [Yersinia proxima]|uniref:LuxR C-terminal-related transcriptional regulator n=1 Tax=Yersinia proxima TaxID=2890316 RepID=A0ABW9F3K3_9GAMM